MKTKVETFTELMKKTLDDLVQDGAHKIYKDFGNEQRKQHEATLCENETCPICGWKRDES